MAVLLRWLFAVKHHALLYAGSIIGWIARLFGLRIHEAHLRGWPDERKIVADYPSIGHGAVGTYFCTIVPVGIRSTELARMLPDGLELAPQDLTPAGEHPAFFMFGVQRGVRADFVPGPGMVYGEFILALPSVRWRNPSPRYRGPFIFMARLYLDHLFPILLGLLYGFAKRLATIRTREDRYEIVHSIGGAPILSLETTKPGETKRASEFPHFRRLGGYFREPFVARTVLGSYLNAIFAFDLDRAWIRPVEARITVHEPFLPGLTPGEIVAKGIDTSEIGAFHIYLPWTLSPPFRPDALRKPHQRTAGPNEPHAVEMSSYSSP